MAHTEELSGFQCGTVIGCHLSNKSINTISALLELRRSTLSAVIVKWKSLSSLCKILFEEVGCQTFSEDEQGLCCPDVRGKLVPLMGC